LPPIHISLRTRKPSPKIDSTKSLLEKWIHSPDKPWIDNYAILLRAEGEQPQMIGTVGAVRLPQGVNDAVEIAYGIHSEFWGKGYASEALGIFVKLYWQPERETYISFSFQFKEIISLKM
jgi:RimJ/RimL family protein N-acetyltransferase